MITVAFCQAFLWMIVMTFYHTGMPTVAQAWYFDTFLRSLEIFCCRYIMMNLQAWTCVELFAGDGNVGKSTKYGLVATAQLDIRYGGQVAQRNAFDLGHAAGLPLLPQHF